MRIPSPEDSFSYNNISFSIKRDDLIDPFISGNKWRKLKYSLMDANHKHKTLLVTFGGAYSNHILALAAAGARHNLSTFAFIRGENVDNEVLFLCQLFGMTLEFVSRTDYRDKHFLYEDRFGDNPSAYFIDEGGSGDLGIKGCAEIIEELKTQYSDVYCAAGTGTTALGIFKGISKFMPNAHLHVIPVLKNLNLNAEFYNRYPSYSNYSIHEDYHFGGYAKTSPSLMAFIQDFTQKIGVLIDPVYTGKLFYAMYDLESKKPQEHSKKSLVIHTGGTFGILGMREKFIFNK